MILFIALPETQDKTHAVATFALQLLPRRCPLCGDDTIIGAVNSQGQVLTRISYLHATSAVTVDIAAGKADGDTSVGHDAISNIAEVCGSTPWRPRNFW